MVLGFRTNSRASLVWLWGKWRSPEFEHLFRGFANKLDDGERVIDAWLDTVGDEMSFVDGFNRGAVLYLGQYRNDVISTNKDDYIYGNVQYYDKWIEYWD
jgi:hypothetical protein